MHLLSIGHALPFTTTVGVTTLSLEEVVAIQDLASFDYIVIHGGDGTIRRVMKALQDYPSLPPFILHPTGSFNVVAKYHRVPSLEETIKRLEREEPLSLAPQKLYRLNSEVFLFSAGNMGDLQHIFVSETLRFGYLKQGMLKYLIVFLFLLPFHLMMTPWMLLSKRRFFIFTPLSFIKKFGSFYGKVQPLTIDLDNHYNFIELDGDVVMVESSILEIDEKRTIEIVVA